MLEYITQGIGRGGFEEGRLPVLLHIECVQLHETRQAEHFHADHAELILIQKGSCQVRVAGGQEAVQAGDFVLCSAGEPHACWTQDGEQATVISCGFTRLLCRGREENCFLEQRERPIVHAGEGSQALEQILLSLMQAAQDAHEQSQEICSYLSAAAILLALRLQRAAEEQIEQARYSLGIRTQLYLDRHYTEPLTLDGIAQAMGVSKYHLDRVFLAGTGCTPVQYITRRRIARAQALLASTDQSIQRIALQCGYSNYTYFTSVFRKHVGRSPGDYRKIIRGIAGTHKT